MSRKTVKTKPADFVFSEPKGKIYEPIYLFSNFLLLGDQI
jgi:hypothetical protein